MPEYVQLLTLFLSGGVGAGCVFLGKAINKQEMTGKTVEKIAEEMEKMNGELVNIKLAVATLPCKADRPPKECD